MLTTYSVLMHHKVSTQSEFTKTVIAEFVSSDLATALLESYNRARYKLATLPEGEITIYVMMFSSDIEQKPSCILQCSIDYDVLFVV